MKKSEPGNSKPIASPCPTVRSLGVLLLSFLVLAFTGCGGGMAQTTPAQPQKPTAITITSPAPGATVSGTVTVSVMAPPGVNIASVQIQVDGANVGSVTASPYNYSWNTTALANGNHTLTAMAQDATGNTVASTMVTVNVSNPSHSPAIAVSISPATANVQVGMTMNFTATLQDDSQNKGVTWTLSSPGCSGATCGSLSATSSPSGVPITYTAPAGVPTPATVNLTATSVADPTKAGTSTITVTPAPPPPIVVTVSPNTANVQVGMTTNFTATVQSDSQNKGVNWTLSGAGCSGAACGALSAASSTSGVAITYTAPASIPSSASVTLTATSVADSTKSASAAITVTAPPPPLSLGIGSPVIMKVDVNGNVHVAWWYGAVGGILFTRSTDGGRSFSNPTTVDARAAAAPRLDLQMALDGAGNINLLWWEKTLDPRGQMFFSRSTDGGATFSAAVNLTNLSNVAYLPQLTVDQRGNINIVWFDVTTMANMGMFFARSTDGGASFSTPLKVLALTSFNVSGLRSVVGPQGQVYIFWSQGDIMFNRSLDGAATFSPAANLSFPTGSNSASPKPFVDARDNIYVAWTRLAAGLTSSTLVFSHSTDQGSTFSGETSVSGRVQSLVNAQQTPFTVDSNKGVNIAWSATVTGLSQPTVFFAQSLDPLGDVFSAPIQLNISPQANLPGADAPAIGVDACGNTRVAWEDGGNIFVSNLVNNTANFSAPVNVAPGANPQIAVDSHGNTYLLWVSASGKILFTPEVGLTCKQ
jgi:hypothetical protein